MKLAICSHGAAKAAVLRWHYSRLMPRGKLLRWGVWGGESDDRFDGAILFGHGASRPLLKSLGAAQTELAELVRVALRPAEERDYATSKAVGMSLRLLRRTNPGLGVVISFADYSGRGHVGTIYQATNWLYLGRSTARHYFDRRTGLIVHSRVVGRWAKDDPRRDDVELRDCPKHRYAYPLTDGWRSKLEPRSLPYPTTRETSGKEPGVQPGQGGSTPTLALHSSSDGSGQETRTG